MLDWGGCAGGVARRPLGPSNRLTFSNSVVRGSMATSEGAGYSLRWNNHQHHILHAFESLLQDEALVDVTLVCEDGRVRAHKVVLSACSPYFQRIFSETPCKHPVIVLKDLRGWEVQSIVDFMYKGEISVSQAQLSSLIRAAESLQVRGLAHMEKEQMHTSSSTGAATLTPARGCRLEAPGSPPVVSSAPLSSTRPYSPVPMSGLYPRAGTENGHLLLSSPFSPSPAPHFEPSPIKSHRQEATGSPSGHCSRDPHRASPLPRRKQARPRRRSGELSAHDLSKSSAASSPASSPSDVPENLCVKKSASHQPGSPPLHGHTVVPLSPRPPSSLLPPHTFSPPPPSHPSSAPSLPHSPTAEPPESPLTPSSLHHKAPSSLPADLTPGERLLDFSMNGSPAPHPPCTLAGLTHPVSAPPHFSWDPPLDGSGFPLLPSVSALSLTPPHMFSMESAQLGLFPPMDGCRNPLLNDLQEQRNENHHILSKRKLGRPKGQHSAPRGGPPRSWTNAELTEALQHVWNKKMTTSQASRIFGIPYNSLLMYVRGKYGKSLKLEQLKKDCLVGAEMLSAPNSATPQPPGERNSGGGGHHKREDKNTSSHASDELNISSTGHEPTDLNFNPYANFYSDFAFPIPVSMIHLLPQSEKNREFPALLDEEDSRRDHENDENSSVTGDDDRKPPAHNGQK